MKKLAITLTALLTLAPAVVFAARTQSSWLYDSSGFIFPAQAPVNVLIQGPNNYLNFGTFSGVSGYGFRDNGGVMQFKNSGGSWANIGTGGGGGGGGSDPFSHTTNFGVPVSSTSTPIWDTAGLMASSTSYFQYASTTELTVTGNTHLGDSIFIPKGNNVIQTYDGSGITIAPGFNGTGNTGGGLQLQGADNSNGQGGSVTSQGGIGTNGPGGFVQLAAGNSNNDAGGEVLINGGSSLGGGQVGGNITLQVGAGDSNSDGSIRFRKSNGTIITFDMSSVSTGRTISIPDRDLTLDNISNAITTTNISGLLRGDGTLVQTATDGTDYISPSTIGTGAAGNCVAWGAGSSPFLTDAGTPCGGGGSNFFTNSGTNTYLNTGSNLEAPSITATSTSAVNSFAGKTGIGTSTPWGLLSVQPNALGSSVPEFVIGSSTKTHFVMDGGGRVIMGGLNPTTALTPPFNYQLELDVPTVGKVNGVAMNVVDSTTRSNGMGIGFSDGRGYVGATNNTALLEGGSGKGVALAVNANSGLGSGTVVLNGTSGGLVGIGSTTPWGQLSINPNALGSGVPEFVVGSSTQTHFQVDGAGKLGIGSGFDTWLYRSASGKLNIYNSTSGQPSCLKFENSGNSVAQICRVNGTNQISGGDSAGDLLINGNRIGFQTGYYGNLLITASNLVGVSGNAGGTTTPWGKFVIEPTAGEAANEFVIGSSTKTDFLVNNSGYVGIGTTTPLSVLTLVDSTSNRGGIQLGSDLVNYRAAAGTWETDGINIASPWQFSIANGGIAALNNAGQNASFSLQHGGTGVRLSDNGSWVGTFGSQDFNIKSNSITAMTILASSQNVGIGTTSPYTSLAVAGATGVLANIFTATSTTATSTFAGPFQALNIAATAQAAGCAQFGAGGFLASTGTACGGSSGGGSGEITFGTTTATDNVAMTNPIMYSTTTTAGQAWEILAKCDVTGRIAVSVKNPGGGTTTLATSLTGTQLAGSFLGGVYNATTTGTMQIALTTSGDLTGAPSTFTYLDCRNPSFIIHLISTTASAISSANGAVNSSTASQVAYYASNGTTVTGSSDVGIFSGLFGLGTTSPMAKLSVQTGSTSVIPFAVATSSTQLPVFMVDANGHVIFSGPKPSCDSNCTFMTGNDNHFLVLTGALKTTMTVTFAKSWGGVWGPRCIAGVAGSAAAIGVNASSTPTTVVLTPPGTISTTYIEVDCAGTQ